MFYRKLNKGFTLVEIIVVLVIVAILAAALIPTMYGMVEQTKVSQCETQALLIYRAYRYEHVKNKIYENPTSTNYQILADGIYDYFDVTATDVDKGIYDGLCPHGGTYTCSFDLQGNLIILCNKHDISTDFTIAAYIPNLKEIQAVTEYFVDGNKNQGDSLDSTATHSWASAPQVTAQLETQLGMSLNNCSWRIVMTQKGKTQAGYQYNYYWTNVDINTLPAGTTGVKAYVYDTKTDTYKTGTVDIVSRTVSGKNPNIPNAPNEKVTYNVMTNFTPD